MKDQIGPFEIYVDDNLIDKIHKNKLIQINTIKKRLIKIKRIKFVEAENRLVNTHPLIEVLKACLVTLQLLRV